MATSLLSTDLWDPVQGTLPSGLQECWLLHLFIQIAGICEPACSSESPRVLPFLVDFLKELQDDGNVCLLCDV